MNDKFDLILEPGGGIRHYWRDIWNYCKLFLFLAWRDILVRYKQTAIGIAWSMLRPFLTMVVFIILYTVNLMVGVIEESRVAIADKKALICWPGLIRFPLCSRLPPGSQMGMPSHNSRTEAWN